MPKRTTKTSNGMQPAHSLPGKSLEEHCTWLSRWLGDRLQAGHPLASADANSYAVAIAYNIMSERTSLGLTAGEAADVWNAVEASKAAGPDSTLWRDDQALWRAAAMLEGAAKEAAKVKLSPRARKLLRFVVGEPRHKATYLRIKNGSGMRGDDISGAKKELQTANLMTSDRTPTASQDGIDLVAKGSGNVPHNPD